jgi:hypothetical protein
VLSGAIQHLDSEKSRAEMLKPVGLNDCSVPNDKKLGIKSTIVLQNATPRTILSLSKIIGMYFHVVHKVDIVGPGGETLKREAFREPQFGGLESITAVKVSHLRLGNINSAAGHFTRVLDLRFLRSIQLDKCIQLPDVFRPLMQAKTVVESLQVIFPPQRRENGSVISTVGDVKKDQKAVSDLLRSAAMQLYHLTIDQSSYSKYSQTGLLLAGIQPHFGTLQELCLGGLETGFELEDIREIALCATRLHDLRIPLPKAILVSVPPGFKVYRSSNNFLSLHSNTSSRSSLNSAVCKFLVSLILNSLSLNAILSSLLSSKPANTSLSALSASKMKRPAAGSTASVIHPTTIPSHFPSVMSQSPRRSAIMKILVTF